MTSFVHIDYPTVHPGVTRAEAFVAVVQQGLKGLNGTKSLAALLLAAMVAALVVVADQLVDTWDDGHLLAAWVLLCSLGFAMMALLADSARAASDSIVRRVAVWTQARARARADSRMWEIAQKDHRVMADIQAAMTRSQVE